MTEKTNKEERIIGLSLFCFSTAIIIVAIIIISCGNSDTDEIQRSKPDWQHEGILEGCCMENGTLYLSLHNDEGLSFHNFSDEEYENLSSFIGKEVRFFSHNENGYEIIDKFYRIIRIKSVTITDIHQV